MPVRVYADANALIRGVEGEDSAAVAIRDLLVADDAVVFSSELTLAEVLVGPLRRSLAEPSEPMARLWRTTYEALFQKAGALEAVPVSVALLRGAASLRAEHRSLKLPDAIHLATAIHGRCDVMLSHDDDLLKTASAHMSTCSLTEAELTALIRQTGLDR